MPLQHTKAARHVVPLLPSVSFVSALFLIRIGKYPKKIIFYLLIICGFIQYYYLTFGNRNTTPWIEITTAAQYFSDLNFRPLAQKYNYFTRIMDTLSATTDIKEETKILILQNERTITGVCNHNVWSNIKWLKQLPFEIMAFYPGHADLPDLINEINQANIILYVGRTDLKNKDALADYFINFLLKERDWFFKSHYLISDKKRKEREIAQLLNNLEQSFSFFQLSHVKLDYIEVLYCDTIENLYIYTRTPVAGE